MLNWNSTREIIISAREIIHQDGIVPEIGGEDNENKGKKKTYKKKITWAGRDLRRSLVQSSVQSRVSKKARPAQGST